MKHYEELTGGEGPRVFYRAERFRASVMLNDISPKISIANGSFDIFDLSMSGLSFFGPKGGSWQNALHKDIPVSLNLGADEVFRGRGKVCRVERLEGQQKISVALTNGYLDIQEIIHKHDDLAVLKEVAHGLNDKSDLVPADYKQVIGDFLYLLRKTRHTLQNFEEKLAKDGSRADERSREIILACENTVLTRWKALSKKANAIVKPLFRHPDILCAIKEYTEQVLTPELVGGKCWHRAYNKPLGYPGDYLIMNYAYELKLEGDTAYEKFCHKLGTSTGEFIATRMTMMKEAIAEKIDACNTGGGQSVNITNLGCGSAQEVANYLQSARLTSDVRFTLIDQDHDALSCAYKNTHTHAAHLGGKASVNCLHATFLEFLSTGKLFENLEPQDMIYSIGLVDYLTDNRAGRLIADLFANLKPGGTLVIGSMRDSEASLQWQIEFITDWSLVYRTEAEMLNMARKLPHDTVRELRADSTGHCHLLYLTRPPLAEV